MLRTSKWHVPLISNFETTTNDKDDPSATAQEATFARRPGRNNEGVQVLDTR